MVQMQETCINVSINHLAAKDLFILCAVSWNTCYGSIWERHLSHHKLLVYNCAWNFAIKIMHWLESAYNRKQNNFYFESFWLALKDYAFHLLSGTAVFIGYSNVKFYARIENSTEETYIDKVLLRSVRPRRTMDLVYKYATTILVRRESVFGVKLISFIQTTLNSLN